MRLDTDSSTSISLIKRVRARDQIAWERLTILYTPVVYGWLRSSELNQEDASDLVQEVFQSVIKSMDDFGREGRPSKFRAWLWGITRNRLMDHFRSKKLQPQAVGGSGIHGMLSEIPIDAPQQPPDEANALTQRALQLIKTDFQESTWQAFWRVTVEEQTPADVASDLGISVAAVYTAKSRVLAHLRIELEGLE
ncbi:MAG: RNA polymerase sigma factor [Rubripirellula sp.]